MNKQAKDLRPGEYIYVYGLRRIANVKKFPGLISVHLAGYGAEGFNPDDEVFVYTEEQVSGGRAAGAGAPAGSSD